MIGWASRIALVSAALVGLAGSSEARERPAAGQPHHGRLLHGFSPGYRSDLRVSGPARPYAWPVADRYHPVSKPYYGRAY